MILTREHGGIIHRVTVLDEGVSWNGKTYESLSKVAFAITGTRWNGPRFFGLRDKAKKGSDAGRKPQAQPTAAIIGRGRARSNRSRRGTYNVTAQHLRCAIYTRVSSDQGLEQDFNSLDAQREAAEAYIKSQAHEGWRLRRDRYDDGGFSGGSMSALRCSVCWQTLLSGASISSSSTRSTG